MKHFKHFLLVAAAVMLAAGCSFHVKSGATISSGGSGKVHRETHAKSSATAKSSSKAGGKAKKGKKHSFSVKAGGSVKIKFSKKVSTGIGTAKKFHSGRIKLKSGGKIKGKSNVKLHGKVAINVHGKIKAGNKGKSHKKNDKTKKKNKVKKNDKTKKNDKVKKNDKTKKKNKVKKNDKTKKNDKVKDNKSEVKETQTVEEPEADETIDSADTGDEEIEYQAPPETPSENDFGYEEPVYGCFTGQVMFLEPNTQSLPVDYSNFDVASVLYACEWDIPPRSFDTGFPGVDDRFEWFAIRYSGAFAVETAGTYEFRINSDDGTKLWIDGELVIENDGIHPPESVSGTVDLASGDHEMVLEYFQGPRYHIALQLFVTPPGGEEGIFSVR